jgi:hypothetical protein
MDGLIATIARKLADDKATCLCGTKAVLNGIVRIAIVLFCGPYAAKRRFEG